MTTFDSRTTVDEVLAGLDLSGHCILLTGCASGIGLETMRALAARGAHIVGTARDEGRAAGACAKVSGRTTPIACDQDDFASVARAVVNIRALGLRFDAIIANAGIMATPEPQAKYGVEQQMRVNHLAHMLLVTRIADLLKDGSGRLVMVSSSAAKRWAPPEGVNFANLDGQAGYKPFPFYGQSKLANTGFAWTMAERLAPRGVTANAIHPGVIASTDLPRSLPGWMKLLLPAARLFGKSIPQGAATQCHAAVHPEMAGVTGRFYADCRPGETHARASDPAFRDKLWAVSQDILARHAPAA